MKLVRRGISPSNQFSLVGKLKRPFDVKSLCGMKPQPNRRRTRLTSVIRCEDAGRVTGLLGGTHIYQGIQYRLHAKNLALALIKHVQGRCLVLTIGAASIIEAGPVVGQIAEHADVLFFVAAQPFSVEVLSAAHRPDRAASGHGWFLPPPLAGACSRWCAHRAAEC